jgi:hypothetical protein
MATHAVDPRVAPFIVGIAADAAYGSGVIVSAVRLGRPGVLLPRIRPPQLRTVRRG